MDDLPIIYVSPAEPAHIRSTPYLESWSFVEQVGADFLFQGHGGWVGVQRKTIPDLIASVRDGRLGKESTQLQELWMRVLIVEGVPSWTADGDYIGQHEGSRWSMQSHYSLLCTIQSEGIHVFETPNSHSTLNRIHQIRSWAQKTTHSSLRARTKTKGRWGTRDSIDWQEFLMQSFPGVSVKVAANIVKHFGRAPLRWDVSEKDLQDVPLVGKGRAQSLIKALED